MGRAGPLKLRVHRIEAILNDSALVQGLRCRDPAAVKHLHECYLPSVWRFVYVRVHRDQHLAEDIVSETVLALIRAVSDEEAEIRNPGAWLRSVASNKVTDHFRAAARVQHLIDEAKKTSPVSDDNDAVSIHELDERRTEIRSIMDDLPEQHRITLEWKYIEKLSVREMADRLGTTEKAVESILFRARRDFRDRVMRADRSSQSAGNCCVQNSMPVRSRQSGGENGTAGKSADDESETEPGVDVMSNSHISQKVTQS